MKPISKPLTDTQLLILLAMCGTLIHILLNGQYGFHRDELDVIMNARQLDWGYVIPVKVEVYGGSHQSDLGLRIRDYMIPFFSTSLKFE